MDTVPATPPQPGAYPPGQKPPVLVWYKVYLFVMVALMLLVAVIGAVILFAPIPESEMGEIEQTILGSVYIGMGIIFSIPFIIALNLPRKPWTWTYHLVMICIGMTGCTIAASIPLLIFWLKPELKAYFNEP